MKVSDPRSADVAPAQGVSAIRLAFGVLGIVLVALAAGYSLVAAGSLVVSSVLAGVFLAAFLIAVLFGTAALRSRRVTLERVRSDLASRITVLGLRQRINAANSERSFDLILRNDGAQTVNNCTIAIGAMRISRFTRTRGEETIDISDSYAQEMPLPLAVPSRAPASAIDSFDLRPKEMKRITICSRKDGPRNPLLIHCSESRARHLAEVRDFAFAEMDLAIFGGPFELHEHLQLSVRDNGILEVLRID